MGRSISMRTGSALGRRAHPGAWISFDAMAQIDADPDEFEVSGVEIPFGRQPLTTVSTANHAIYSAVAIAKALSSNEIARPSLHVTESFTGTAHLVTAGTTLDPTSFDVHVTGSERLQIWPVTHSGANGGQTSQRDQARAWVSKPTLRVDLKHVIAASGKLTTSMRSVHSNAAIDQEYRQDAYEALDDGLRLSEALDAFGLPNVGLSADGVLTLEWTRDDRGALVAFTGGGTATFAVRSPGRFYSSLITEFLVSEGVPVHLRSALEQMTSA